jgi:hypothetical protein
VLRVAVAFLRVGAQTRPRARSAPRQKPAPPKPDGGLLDF